MRKNRLSSSCPTLESRTMLSAGNGYFQSVLGDRSSADGVAGQQPMPNEGVRLRAKTGQLKDGGSAGDVTEAPQPVRRILRNPDGSLTLRYQGYGYNGFDFNLFWKKNQEELGRNGQTFFKLGNAKDKDHDDRTWKVTSDFITIRELEEGRRRHPLNVGPNLWDSPGWAW